MATWTATSTNMIRTRICMISDTHTFPPDPAHDTSMAYRFPLPKADILLHAGDITKVGHRIEYEAMIEVLKQADAELKIVIAGNHDISLDEDFYLRDGHLRHRRYRGGSRYGDHHRHGRPPGQSSHDDTIGRNNDQEDLHDEPDPLTYTREIQQMWTDPDLVRTHNIIYMTEGIRTFTVPSTGARFTLYATPYQPEFCNWAFAYPRHQDRFNPQQQPPPHPSGQDTSASASTSTSSPQNPIPDFPNVDVMLTHGPPDGTEADLDFDRTVFTREHVGCEHLWRAVKRVRPRLHVFGHIHEGYGAVRMDWRSGRARRIETDPETVLEERCAYYDASGGGGGGRSSESAQTTIQGVGGRSGEEPLRFGEETLFVNASVVTVRYKPVNAPWVVDLDLPAATASV